MTDREKRIEHDLARARRGRRVMYGAAAVVCFFALAGFVGAVVANVVNTGQGTDITNINRKIEKSACASNPTQPTRECESIRQKLAANEGIEAECIAHQRVTGTKGRNCPRFYLTDSDAQTGPTSETVGQGGNGGIPATKTGGDRGVSVPVDGGSDGPPAPGHSGTHSPPAPPEGGSEPGPAPVPAPEPMTTTAPAQSSPTGAVTAPEPAAQPGLIQSTVQGVDEAITPTVCGAAELLRHLCS